MKKVVISGATSMIGVALVKACINKNIECLCMIRKNSTKANRLPTSPLITLLECNLEDVANCAQAAEQNDFDVFFHLGWDGTSKDYRNDAVVQSKNILYTLDAVNLAQRFNCKTFVGIGSQAEYGRVTGPISPQTATNPETAYGIAKNAAGRLSAVRCAQIGLRHIWGRVFSVYGDWDSKDTLISTLISEMSQGISPKLTSSEQLWDYLYVNDAGEAICLIGERGKDESVYNIGSGYAFPLRNYIETVKKTINNTILPQYGAMPYAKNQVMHLCADITSLTNDTGFKQQVSFEDGIQKTIEWWNNTQINCAFNEKQEKK